MRPLRANLPNECLREPFRSLYDGMNSCRAPLARILRSFLTGMMTSVTKYSLSAASLVAAVPAAFLAYVLVMAFLQKPGFDKMPGFFQIISGLALTLVTLMVLMPVGILIFGKKSDKPAEPKEKPAGQDEADEEQAEAADEGEDLAVDEEADDLFEDDEFGDEEAFDDFEDEDEDEFK